MTREQRKRAEMLAHELLALLARTDPLSDTPTGHCEFCGRAPRGLGWRMDRYRLGRKEVATCSLCLGSLSRAWHKQNAYTGPENYDEWYPRYVAFRNDPFNVAPEMLVAEWAAKRLLARAKRT